MGTAVVVSGVALALAWAGTAAAAGEGGPRAGGIELATNPDLPAGVDLVRLAATYDPDGALEARVTLRGPVMSFDAGALAMAAGRMVDGACATGFTDGGAVAYAPLRPDRPGPLVARVGVGEDFSEVITRVAQGSTFTLRVASVQLRERPWDCVVVATVPIPVTAESRPYDMGAAFALFPTGGGEGPRGGRGDGGRDDDRSRGKVASTPARTRIAINGPRAVTAAPHRWRVVRVAVARRGARPAATPRVTVAAGAGVAAYHLGLRPTVRSRALGRLRTGTTQVLAVRLRLGRSRPATVRLIVVVDGRRTVHTLRVAPRRPVAAARRVARRR